ncbi:MAG TPA: UbiA family prenyltransferase [Caulobacteraceae bacterium]
MPDAAPSNWVDRYAPAALRPWLKLGRFDRPTGIWLLLLPGWQGLALAAAMRGEWPDPLLLALFLAGAALMRAAGCAYNDIVDADIDAKVARTALRPIPAGQISKRGAWVYLLLCSLGGLGVLLSLNFLSVLLGLVSLGLVAAYPFMKRITWWPQAWLGLTFNWGALLGFAAAQPGAPMAQTLTLLAGAWSHGVDLTLAMPSGLQLPALLLYASGIAWTLGYDTIYAVQDIEDDALVGVKSSARRLGEQAPMAVLIFYILTAFLALSAWWFGGLGPLSVPLIALYAAHLARQPTKLKLNDSAGALALFKSNTVAGLLLFAALVAGRWQIGLLAGLG